MKGNLISWLIIGLFVLNVIVIDFNNSLATGSSSENKPRTSSRGLEYFEMDMNISEVCDASFIKKHHSVEQDQSVAGGGDVNGDGYDDMLINVGNITYLILGKSSGWEKDFNLSNADASFIEETGYYLLGVADAGDVNADGFDDILIGVPDLSMYGLEGKVYLIFGKASGWSPNQNLSTANASFIGGKYFGSSIAGAGDVNGDGFDDIIMSDFSGGGKTYLIFGRSSGWSMNQSMSTADASFIGEDANDLSGYPVSAAGDVNGDGFYDILIGAKGHNNYVGKAYLIFGKASGWKRDQDLSTIDVSFVGEYGMHQIGLPVSGAGDVNGDGFDDILIKAQWAGETYLILGKSDGWKNNQGIYNADASFIGGGNSLAGAGDINVDGFDDILIGCRDKNEVYLILGKTDGWKMNVTLVNVSASFIGNESDKIGVCVAGAGDVNGDGGSDIIIEGPITYLITGFGITEPLEVHSVKAYADDSYPQSQPINSAEISDTIYIELKGVDGNSSSLDKARVIVDNLNSSAIDMPLILQETGINTGVYRNNLRLSSRNVQGKRFLNVSLDDIIKISSYKDPTKYTLIKVTAPIALKPFEDQLTAIEDTEYRVNYWNIGYNEVSDWIFKTDSSWLNWDDETHDIYGTPDNGDVGSCWARLNITDSLGNYDEHDFIIKVENTIPNIQTMNIIYANQSEYFYVDYNSDDEGLGSTEWSIITKPSVKKWLEFDTSSGILNGTPSQDDIGKYDINITIDDSNGGTNWTNFELEVLDLNYAPEILVIPNNSTKEDELYHVNFSAIDKDGDVDFNWDLQTGPNFLSMGPSSGELSGTPTNEDVGDHFVNVTVKDLGGYTSWLNYTLEVINVNDPPVIMTDETNIAYTGVKYIVDYNATDIDNSISNQTWSVNTNATWLSMDNRTGILSGTPTSHDVDSWFTVNIKVSDGDGGSDWQNFILSVLKGNEPPIITTIDNETAWVGHLFEVDYDALDDQAIELLEWSLDTNASWLSIDTETGILHGTPSIDDLGNGYWVNITVNDFENSYDFHYFIIKVIEKPNEIPKLRYYRLIPTKGDTNTEFTFSLLYSDADSQPPTIIQVVIDGIEYDMELKPDEIAYHGKYEFKTTLTKGEHTYYFTASDGIDPVRSDDFKTPYINKPQAKDSKENGIESMVIGGIIVVIIIIVVLILSFLMLHRKKKKKEEKNISGPEQPSIPPNVYPAVITPQIPQQQAQVQQQAYPQDNIYTESPVDTTTTITPTVIQTIPQPGQQIQPMTIELPIIQQTPEDYYENSILEEKNEIEE